ncbi:hypothetical protein HK104_001377 [Borealophlyctis nickersoniae]|nr:hypothetical protein HK104_001377 [Borealophlyctis nickersoniae]
MVCLFLLLLMIQVWEESDLCHVIVLTSPDDCKAFCAGGDVKRVVQLAQSRQPEDIAEALRFFEEEYKLNHLIGNLKKPFIAVMDGITMGGGVGLSVHAPFRIATENTVFAMPESSIGLFPDVGGSFFLPRLDGQLGTYLGLTGRQLKGEEVFMAGIATHYIPSGRLKTLINRLAELETEELDTVNGILEEYVADPTSVEKWNTWSLGGDVGLAINRCFRFDTLEEIVEALEKENTQWAKDTLDHMKTLSPTSLKLTLMQIRRGAKMHFAECFRQEYYMVKQIVEHIPDFYEGVTAKLINKPSTKPSWTPSWEEMDKLTPDIIERMFFKPPLGFPSLQLISPYTYFEYPHRTMSGLPTISDVSRVVRGRGRRTKTVEPRTKDEVVEWFENNWGAPDSGMIGLESGMPPIMITIAGGLGRGKTGLREKVVSILDRYVEETENGLKSELPR